MTKKLSSRRSFTQLRNFASAAMLAVVLSACSGGGSLLGGGGPKASDGNQAVPPGGIIAPDLASADEKAVATLYNDGLSNISTGSYKRAQQSFAEVERQHPYSKWATKSILMQAFSAYQRRSYDEAVNASRRFITLHPGHKDTPYAYYLLALSEFEGMENVERDQVQTQRALVALDELVRRYPDSPYAADAQQKMSVANERLAGKEMTVGRYYVKRGAYLAGINRFKTVVVNYQTSAQTPEALYRLTESYLALGVVSEAQTAAAVLGHNYQNSKWYREAFNLLNGLPPAEDRSSWISKAFNRVLPSSG
jgi:outer membrane protein assembly factor BamD